LLFESLGSKLRSAFVLVCVTAKMRFVMDMVFSNLTKQDAIQTCTDFTSADTI